ncbi:unnamed protein product [Heterobilharzia americana]|nr:unnamed protein product [Heterobilharzia americana]
MEEVHELDKINGGREHVPVVQMKKTIGLASSITIIVGSMIGSGIFVSPTGIMENVRSIGASLIIWVACGIFSMLGAYCYAELGTMIHRSGGDYIYVYEAFGPFLGFLRLWSEVVVARPASVAIMSITFAKYIAQPIFPDCDQPETAVRLLAAVCIILLSFVNAFSVRLSTFVQDIFTYAKVAALIMIIITGLVQIGFGQVDGLTGAFDNSDWSPGSLTKAFYVGLFAYSGWNYLNCMIEEMNNPRRDLPLAIIISCLLVTFIYTMANVAYVTVVSPYEILTTPAVAITFAVRIYGVMWWIMPIFVALSTFGGVNGTIMTTSRMFFCCKSSKSNAKIIMLFACTPIDTNICSYIYMYNIINIFKKSTTSCESTNSVSDNICINNSVTGHFAFVAAPTESLFGVAIICTGIPVYLIGCVWKNKPKSFQRKFIQNQFIPLYRRV